MAFRLRTPASLPLFNLFMDFAMQVFFEKCSKIYIISFKLNYRIPLSATQSKSAIAGQHTLDWVGNADNLVLLFENITNVRLALNVLFTLS